MHPWASGTSISIPTSKKREMSQNHAKPGCIRYEGTSSKLLDCSGQVLSFRGQPESASQPALSAPVLVGRLYLVKDATDRDGRPMKEEGGGRIQKTFTDAALAEEY